MKNLTQNMNMAFGVVEGAHILKKVNLGMNAYDTLALVCSEQNVDLHGVSDSNFESTAICLEKFCRAANDTTGYTVSVWFDK